MAIQSMVTRRDFDGRVWGASQRVTVDEALRIGALHGARAPCEERDKGSTAAGKLATSWFSTATRTTRIRTTSRTSASCARWPVAGGRTVHSAQ